MDAHRLAKIFKRAPQPDPLFKSTYTAHADSLCHTLEQRGRDKILERNKLLRKEKPLNDLSFGRMVASIPFEDWELLRREYPELTQGDKEIRQRCMFKILKDPKYSHFLVRDHI